MKRLFLISVVAIVLVCAATWSLEGDWFWPGYALPYGRYRVTKQVKQTRHAGRTAGQSEPFPPSCREQPNPDYCDPQLRLLYGNGYEGGARDDGLK
jgi:hypothetical protein